MIEIKPRNKIKPKPKPKLDVTIRPKKITVTLPTKTAKTIAPSSTATAEVAEWATIRNEKGDIIHLDSYQIKAVELAISGSSFALIGSAGTGKTTTVQAIILAILVAHAKRLHQTEYRIKGEGNMVPGISIGVVAFANRAANNIRRKAQAHPDLKEIMNYNVTTLHNMLEYTVEFYYDPETDKNKRRYFPQKDELNKLELTHLFVEEGSQVAVGDNSIWDQMYKALPNNCQVIFLGDINQIPPVGGKPVLAYAMRDLPVVELKHIHRQALDNPIIRQATNCLRGKPVEQDIIKETGRGVRVFHPEIISKRYRGKKLAAYQFRGMLTNLIGQQMDMGQYDPYQDIVLLPNNKKCDKLVSTQDINAEIAWKLARKYNREVYEIRAGFNTVYVAVGDKVMVDKFEGIVEEINRNASYVGKMPKEPSNQLNYHGQYVHVDDDFEFSLEQQSESESESEYEYQALDLDKMLDEDTSQDEKTRAASHTVTIRLEDDTTVTLSSAGDFGQTVFSLGYAITVHKAQGSEWRNCIVAIHDSATMLIYRELLYTAMTRAIERLDIFAHKHTLTKAINNPRIKGDTLQDKLEFFAGGYLDLEVPLVPPKIEVKKI